MTFIKRYFILSIFYSNYCICTKGRFICSNNFNICCTFSLCCYQTILCNNCNFIICRSKCKHRIINYRRNSTIRINCIYSNRCSFLRSKLNIRISYSKRSNVCKYRPTKNIFCNNCIITIISTSTISRVCCKSRTTK